MKGNPGQYRGAHGGTHKFRSGVKQESTIQPKGNSGNNGILLAALKMWELKQDAGHRHSTGWRQKGKKTAPVIPV